MDKTRRTKAGRFGTVPAFAYGKQLDAGITASATVKIPIANPCRKSYIERLSVAAATLPIGGAAITATLQKKAADGGAVTALTAATDLTVANLTALKVAIVALLSTLTDVNRVLQEGDYLYVDVIAAGTVTTQPVGLQFIVELSVLE